MNIAGRPIIEHMIYEVTLAMPVYNVCQFVERALLSALNQTFDSIEFLIIDDKGSDNSMDIVRQIKSSHPRGEHIRIIEHPYNIGIGGARNSAIFAAAGKYLFFMDSDDSVEPFTIELLYKTATESESDIVLGSHQEIKGHLIQKSYIFPDISIKEKFAIARWMEEARTLYEIPTWNKLYKLSFLRDKQILCIPHQRIEDPVFTFKTALFAKSVSSLSKITYNYYINNGSHAHRMVSDDYFDEYLVIFEERKKMIAKFNGMLPAILVSYFFQPFFEFFIPRVLFSNLNKRKKASFFERMAQSKEIEWQPCSVLSKDYRFIYWMVVNKHSILMRCYYKVRPYIKRYVFN